MRPMTIDDPAYPFLAFSGIPSVSFHFIKPNVRGGSFIYLKQTNKQKKSLLVVLNIKQTVMCIELSVCFST